MFGRRGLGVGGVGFIGDGGGVGGGDGCGVGGAGLGVGGGLHWPDTMPVFAVGAGALLLNQHVLLAFAKPNATQPFWLQVALAHRLQQSVALVPGADPTSQELFGHLKAKFCLNVCGSHVAACARGSATDTRTISFILT